MSSNQSVTFTASVASATGPVGSGTVTFCIDGGPPGAPVPVAAGGTAIFSVDALVTGANPTVSWAQLEDLGIDDGLAPAVARTITLRVTLDDVVSAPDEGHFRVTNTAPTSVLTGARAATVGEPGRPG